MATVLHMESLQAITSSTLPILADSAIKGLLVLALAWLVTWRMRMSPASIRHMVWFVALSGLAAMPVLGGMLPAWQILPASWNLGMGQLPEQAPVTSRVPIAPLPVQTPSPDIDAGSMPARPAPLAAAQPQHVLEDAPAAASERGAATLWTWAFLAWAAIAGILLMRILLGWLYLLWMGLHPPRRDDPAWHAVLQQCQAQMRTRSTVRLLQGDARAMPMTWGIFRPMILVPSCASDWQRDRRRVILLHELAHIQRRDCLTQLIAEVACALHWFNPLAWLASKCMQAEAERACDDRVLSAGSRPADYAEHLLQIASNQGRTLAAAAMTGIPMARPSRLEGRLLAILDNKRSRRALTLGVVVVALVGVVFLVVPLAMLRAAGPAPRSNVTARTLHFPADRFLGVLYVRDVGKYRDDHGWASKGWEELGPARGTVTVPAGKELRLVVHRSAGDDLSPLKVLQPDDLVWLECWQVPVDDDNLQYVAYLTGLKSLTLRYAYVSDAGLKHLEGLTSLRSLNLFKTQVTGKGLTTLAKMTSLESLDLSMTAISSGELPSLGRLTHLKFLGLANTTVSDEGLACIEGMKSLEEVGLDHTNVTDAGLVHLAGCTSLKVISLERTAVKGPGLAHVAKLPAIEDLALQDTGVADPDLKHIARMTSLKRLNLESTQVTGAGLSHLEGLKNLERLTLPESCRGAGLAHLAKLPSLKELWYVPSSQEDWRLLARMTSLEKLHLSGSGADDATIQYLEKLPALKELTISRAAITDKAMAVIGKIASLERLSLERDESIRGEGFTHMTALPKLTELYLHGMKLNSAAFERIGQLSRLQQLRISGTLLRDGDLAAIGKLTGLVHLSMECDHDERIPKLRDLTPIAGLIRLEEFVSDQTQVTDDSLAIFKGMKNLNMLSITGDFTDEGLRHLEGLRRLRSLSISGDRLTPVGMAWLQKRLPTLQYANAPVRSASTQQPAASQPVVSAPALTLPTILNADKRDEKLFYVMGTLRSGVFSVVDRTITLAQALAAAGGPRPESRFIHLLRPNSQGRLDIVAVFPVDNMPWKQSDVLQSGDIVYVSPQSLTASPASQPTPPPGTVQVSGNVQRPGIFGLPTGGTLLKALVATGMDTTHALGVYTLIVRTFPDGQRGPAGRFAVADILQGRIADPPLQSRDVIQVEESTPSVSLDSREVLVATWAKVAETLTQARVQMEMLKAQYGAVEKGGLNAIPLTQEIINMIEADPQIAKAEMRRAGLLEQRHSLAARLGEGHRSVGDLDKRIEAVEQELQQLRMQKLDERKRAQVEQLRLDMLAAADRVALLDRRLQELRADARSKGISRDLEPEMANERLVLLASMRTEARARMEAIKTQYEVYQKVGLEKLPLGPEVQKAVEADPIIVDLQARRSRLVEDKLVLQGRQGQGESVTQDLQQVDKHIEVIDQEIQQRRLQKINDLKRMQAEQVRLDLLGAEEQVKAIDKEYQEAEAAAADAERLYGH